MSKIVEKIKEQIALRKKAKELKLEISDLKNAESDAFIGYVQFATKHENEHGKGKNITEREEKKLKKARKINEKLSKAEKKLHDVEEHIRHPFAPETSPIDDVFIPSDGEKSRFFPIHVSANDVFIPTEDSENELNGDGEYDTYLDEDGKPLISEKDWKDIKQGKKLPLPPHEHIDTPEK